MHRMRSCSDGGDGVQVLAGDDQPLRSRLDLLTPSEFAAWETIVAQAARVPVPAKGRRPSDEELVALRASTDRRKAFEAGVAAAALAQLHQVYGTRGTTAKTMAQVAEHLDRCAQQADAKAAAAVRTARKQARTASHWMHVGSGRLTLAAAPTATRVAAFKERGATRFVTLLMATEPHLDAVRGACSKLDLGWSHVPLSGGRVNGPDDAASLCKVVAEVAEQLRAGEHVVVHCAAGLHRTGIVGYLVLRCTGLPNAAAMAGLLAMREITHEEMAMSRLPVPTTRSQGIDWAGFKHPNLAAFAGELHTMLLARPAPRSFFSPFQAILASQSRHPGRHGCLQSRGRCAPAQTLDSSPISDPSPQLFQQLHGGRGQDDGRHDVCGV